MMLTRKLDDKHSHDISPSNNSSNSTKSIIIIKLVVLLSARLVVAVKLKSYMITAAQPSITELGWRDSRRDYNFTFSKNH